MKFRKWEDKQRSLYGKILLITGLRSLGIKSYSLKDLKYTKFLRPYFDGLVDFNISHSGEYTICAISETNKIGIDIEEIQDIPLFGFDSQFSKKEWGKVLQAENRLQAFYTLWTQKEAFLKAIGTGLNLALNEVVIRDNKITWDDREWYLKEIKLDKRYVSHLATDITLPTILIEKVEFF
ncbi:MAG: 4'-phosphopantetheinyl transferase superfamily protein [Chitinophagaceae bacterium]